MTTNLVNYCNEMRVNINKNLFVILDSIFF